MPETSKTALIVGHPGHELFVSGWLRRETLFPVGLDYGFEDREEDVPEYERHGEDLVAAGEYASVIRYRQHVAPLARALVSFARRGQ